MRITRLLLGACAPLALAGAAAADPAAGAPDAGTPTADSAPQAPLGPTVRDGQGREGRVHTVVRGDTLWDISEAYLGSPWVWPSVWKANPEVKNPHRIYPGDHLWISSSEMRRLTDEEAAAFVQPPAAPIQDAPAQSGRVHTLPLGGIGFISAAQLETAGSILGSPEPERMLTANRRAYVSLGEGQARDGDRFTIVREKRQVRDPETDRVLGVEVDRLGWLEITEVGLESSEAMIRVSQSDIAEGDRLIPRVEEPREVVVRPGAVAVEGQIAKLLDKHTWVAQQDVVFLNRGTDHGVDSGATLEVYRPGQLAKDAETRTSHLLPDEIVANLLVVRAEASTAVAVVTHATRPLERGDHFRGAQSEVTSHAESSSQPLEATQWTSRTIDARAGQPPAKGPGRR